MDDKELDRWLQARRARKPLATNLAMLDGFVTALAAGPLDLDLIGSLLAALALDQDALNTGATPEFAAIKAAADRFNRITGALEDGIVEPHHRRRGNGDTWPADWCEGFLAAVKLNLAEWHSVMDPANQLNGLMLPILLYCKDEQGRPYLGPPRPGPQTQTFISEVWNDIPLSVATIRNHYHFIPTGQSRRR
jgi:uncharacterized protein